MTPGVRWGRGAASVRPEEPLSVAATLRSPVIAGFVGVLGVLTAIALGVALTSLSLSLSLSLSTILISIGAAMFIALGLDPVVRLLVGRGLRRPLAIGSSRSRSCRKLLPRECTFGP